MNAFHLRVRDSNPFPFRVRCAPFHPADKSWQRLPHDFGHVSESAERVLLLLHHAAWGHQQMSRATEKSSIPSPPLFLFTWPAIRVMQKVVVGCGPTPGCWAFAYGCRLKGFNRAGDWLESGSWLLAAGMQIVCCTRREML